MSTFSLAGLAAEMAAITVRMGDEREKALEKGAQIIETAAKEAIGTYKYGWPPLKDATILHKKSGDGDQPLLDTGELRDSIAHEVVSSNEAHIGTPSQIGFWQEFGTSRGIPPRPFMGGAANEKGEEVCTLIGAEIVKPLIGS